MAKGQAAVEFLTTYGWAILALILVLGVLVSSGLLSPNYLLSEECSFGTNLPCNTALFNEGSDTKIMINVTNGFPYQIRIVRFQLVTTDGSQTFSGFDIDANVGSGAGKLYTGTLTRPQAPKGSVKKFAGNITYISCAPELGPGCSGGEHVLNGRVTAKVLE